MRGFMKTGIRTTFLLLTLASSASLAGTYGYRSVLIGERAVGLGGAYIALSDTGEGGFYNPAGLAFIDRSTLSVAANLYNLTRGTRSSALKFAGDEADLAQNSFNSIPQTASFAKKISFPWEKDREYPRNAVALNVVVPDQVDLAGRVDFDVASGQALLTRSIQDRTLFIGPSYARKLSDRFSLGLSAFYVVRMIENMAFIYEDDETTLGQGFLQDIRTIGNFAMKVGARYSPLENFWIGLTYQPPSIRLHGDAARFSSTIVQDKATSTVERSVADDRNLKPNDPLPQTVGVGFAYEVRNKWTVAADALAYLGDDFLPFSDNSTAEIQREFITNFSAGGEYYVKPEIPLRLGVFSNFSSAPLIQNGVSGQADHVDFIGFAVSGSVESSNTSVTLGTTIRFGWGEGIDNQKNKIEVSENHYGILLAGSYKF